MTTPARSSGAAAAAPEGTRRFAAPGEATDPAHETETDPQLSSRVAEARTCVVCGNHYDKAFTIVRSGAAYVFDCFECAIHALAPTCSHCGCRIVGHGMESAGEMYCCSHCAAARGVPDMKDRV